MGSPTLHERAAREAVAARWLAGARAEEHCEEDCKGLWVAVLCEAIHDLVSPNDLVRRSTRLWVDSRDTGPSSFEWICSLLGANPTAVRERLAGGGARRIESHLHAVRCRERRQGAA
jgi:hypothetical protein